MALIIPGVQVQVVKEVLPQQLSPSGVLGLTGFVEKGGDKVQRASSWTRFIEVFGAAAAYSLPEARQALDNGVYELVISPLAASAGKAAAVSTPSSPKRKLLAAAKAAADKGDKDAAAKAEADAKAASDSDATTKGLSLVARAPGSWSNSLSVKIKYRDNVDKSVSFDLSVKRPGGEETGWESFRDVRLANLGETLERSGIVAVDKTVAQEWPTEGDYTITRGEDAPPEAYTTALTRLEGESDVDMVLASVPPETSALKLAKIYGDVIAHCNKMSTDCKGRIGFGQVPLGSDIEASKQLASNLVSDRFVLVAPNGVVGAVAGKVGGLPYFHSPTFKAVSGIGALESIAVEQQRGLLTGNVVPVVLERGKGVIILRGLTTDGDQISVRRVADYSVRVMKMVGDLFIGLLNNADGRSALKQKLVAELLQMEKDGAIVPSTDGKDPSHKVEVYSSQTDFAKGIVRVNMAVRPVRAIDYIYATITIQV
jgi:hypothetical protein